MAFRDFHGFHDVRPRENDRELLSSISTSHILGTASTQRRCRLLEHLIPEGMTMGVIEVLETVEVGQDQGYLGSVPDGSRKLGGKTLVEVGTIPEPGQSVELRSLGEHPEKTLGPERRTDPGPELGHIEWFADEVDRPQIKASDTIHGLSARRDEYRAN